MRMVHTNLLFDLIRINSDIFFLEGMLMLLYILIGKPSALYALSGSSFLRLQVIVFESSERRID